MEVPVRICICCGERHGAVQCPDLPASSDEHIDWEALQLIADEAKKREESQ